MTFPAQSPDLRRFPLVAGASRSVVRSPRSAAPRIRFLFVDSRVRSTLRSAYASRRTPCASLRSLRPGSGRTFTSKSSPMPGPPQRDPVLAVRLRPPGRYSPHTLVPINLGPLGGVPVARITARNRLTSIRTARSAALAVGRWLIAAYQNSGKTALNGGNVGFAPTVRRRRRRGDDARSTIVPAC